MLGALDRNDARGAPTTWMSTTVQLLPLGDMRRQLHAWGLLAEVIEREFGTGYVRVSRTDVDPNTGGYTWYVTFASLNQAVPLLEADGSTLSGTDPTVKVVELNSTPEKVRGVVHAFTRPSMSWRNTGPDDWEEFVEQSYLYPAVKQRQDLFGCAVALHGDVAIVGAKNRDSYVSFKNGGAVFAYNRR